MQGFQKFNVMNCVTWTWIQMPLQKGVCLIVLYGRRLVFTILPNSDWRWQGVRKSLRLSWQLADNRTMLFYSKLFLMVFRWFFFLHSANSFWLFLFLLHTVKILLGANIRFLLMITIQFLISLYSEEKINIKAGDLL